MTIVTEYLYYLIFCVLALISIFDGSVIATEPTAAVSRPHIVFVLADDLVSVKKKKMYNNKYNLVEKLRV